jgi:NTE family protein
MSQEARDPRISFVLGGGGHMGAHEVGMIRALIERGIVPDLVLGTSIGALNGAAVAADPSVGMVDRLERVWLRLTGTGVLGGSVVSRAVRLARTGTHLHSNRPLRAMLEAFLPARIEELAVPFQCVAASVERTAEHWFTEGPLADAVLASAALPGVLPIVRIGDGHFMDGGLVNSIPLDRAVALGAREIYVLHVGRIERPLTAPATPWGVALTAFEIARRHRFAHDLGSVPSDVAVHVLPTGSAERTTPGLRRQLRYGDFSEVQARMARAYESTSSYLDDLRDRRS